MATASSRPRFRLYQFEDATMPDAWGKPAPVRRLIEVVEVEIVGKRPYDNGYETVMIDIASDGTRIFRRPIEVDYFGGSDWYEDNPKGSGRSWRQAGRLADDRYVDAAGKPFTRAQLVADFGQ